MNIDRSKVNQALAKAIAYKQCGKETDAAAPEMLECIQETLRQLNALDFSLSTNWNAGVKENAIQLLEHAINKAEGRK